MVETKKSDDNLIAAIAYLLGWLSGLIVYVMYKDKNKYVAFHGLQSLILSVAMIPVAICFMVIVWVIAALVSVFTFGIGMIIAPIGMLLLLVIYVTITVFLMYKAYKGEKYKIPVIGDFTEKQM